MGAEQRVRGEAGNPDHRHAERGPANDPVCEGARDRTDPKTDPQQQQRRNRHEQHRKKGHLAHRPRLGGHGDHRGQMRQIEIEVDGTAEQRMRGDGEIPADDQQEQRRRNKPRQPAPEPRTALQPERNRAKQDQQLDRNPGSRLDPQARPCVLQGQGDIEDGANRQRDQQPPQRSRPHRRPFRPGPYRNAPKFR